MARFKIVLAFFAILSLVATIVLLAFIWQKSIVPQNQVEMKLAGASTSPKPDLGRKHYTKAINFIKEDELISARNELQYMLDIYSDSPTLPEAKRVLGELNLDLILSKVPIEGKSEYKVKSGDFLSTIARRNKTTIDYIMRANSKTTTLIYPNEKLSVFNLDCSAIIDLDNSTLTILSNNKFIKEYEIVETNLPTIFPNSVTTSVNSKVAYYKGSTLKFDHANYLDAMKWIRTGRNGLFIRQVITDNSITPKPLGVMLAKPDMEEIYTILRHGSTVKVLPRAKRKRSIG